MKNALFQGFLFLKAQHKVSSRWQRTVERGAEEPHHPHRPPREPSPQRGWRVITTRHLHGGAGTKKEKALQFREGRVKGGQDLYFFAAFLFDAGADVGGRLPARGLFGRCVFNFFGFDFVGFFDRASPIGLEGGRPARTAAPSPPGSVVP